MIRKKGNLATMRVFPTFRVVLSAVLALVVLGCSGTSQKPDKKMIVKGQKLFYDKGCAECHEEVNEYGASKGPDLRYHTHGGNADWISSYLRDPQSVKPGTKMPNPNLSDDEIRLLTAYVLSLRGTTPK